MENGLQCIYIYIVEIYTHTYTECIASSGLPYSGQPVNEMKLTTSGVLVVCGRAGVFC